ncbi:PilZ domain-containing protein [Lysobacter changpingensis]|uniref:PilZ domain-containing protein n=1 Tax=Lysobacter changpingensis TaxID=2792784 RepID=UPI001A8FF8A0|nr:PilZ domain-containing protein [Lysobacter changpingensis]
MTSSAADAQLFGDVLAYQDRRPAAFVPGPADPAAAHLAAARAEMLLTSLALSENARSEDGDEHVEPSSSLQRVEAKLDLVLGLLGAMLRERGDLPPPTVLRWSTRGACIDVLGDALAIHPGARGVLRVQPAEWLPDCIELPAHAIAVEGARAWLAFDPLPPTLADALERHLFRLHRKQVAESRRLKDL